MRFERTGANQRDAAFVCGAVERLCGCSWLTILCVCLFVFVTLQIDAICKVRGRGGDSTGVHDTVVNQLLSKIDGVNALNNILVIGMTNRKGEMRWECNEARVRRALSPSQGLAFRGRKSPVSLMLIRHRFSALCLLLIVQT